MHQRQTLLPRLAQPCFRCPASGCVLARTPQPPPRAAHSFPRVCVLVVSGRLCSHAPLAQPLALPSCVNAGPCRAVRTVDPSPAQPSPPPLSVHARCVPSFPACPSPIAHQLPDCLSALRCVTTSSMHACVLQCIIHVDAAPAMRPATALRLRVLPLRAATAQPTGTVAQLVGRWARGLWNPPLEWRPPCVSTGLGLGGTTRLLLVVFISHPIRQSTRQAQLQLEPCSP